jgi:DNA-binding LytR/AlgR family response regulator
MQCIAIDDEPLALSKIENFARKIPYLNLQAQFPSALEALAYLKKNKTDLIFLDIQMDNLTGIQFLEVLNPRPLIIFTTAYGQYALQGYELDVCDYLLKPFSFERFLKAVEKAYQLTGYTNKKSDKADQYIFVKTNYKYEKIDFDTILYIESQGDYLQIVTNNAKTLTLTTLKNIEEILPSGRFFRVHKSFIVALDKIKSVEYARIHLDQLTIPIGDAYRDSFWQKLTR